MGLGYVGAVTAACLAHLGHRVLGVDIHALKVNNILAGQAPFFEPGLEQLIHHNVAAGRLTASTSLAGSLTHAEVVLICVGTPSERSGDLDFRQLRRVSEEIGKELRAGGRPASPPLVVAVRSTVFPGTCESVVAPALEGAGARVVSNPEFLREGNAVEDFLQPSLLVVGGADAEACRRVAALYTPLPVQPRLVSLRTAEMIKYACNSFHALKIVFANEMGALCSQLGVSGREIMATLCEDAKLNISPAYLKPGFAFGGSCLPKDLRALVYRARYLDLHLPVLESIRPSNEEHLRRAIQSVLDLPAERLGMFGLAFKENTDDLRESPVLALIEHLLGKGRHVRIFDPHIRVEEIYGSNREFLLSAIPHISRWLDPTLDHLLGWAQHLVLAQTPAPELAQRIRQSGLPILDLAQSL